MKKNLSSLLTIPYKIFGTLWLIMTLTIFVGFIIGTKNLWGLLILIMILPSIAILKLHQVEYDDQKLYLKKWFKEETIDFSNIKSLNEGELTGFDPFFEIEIFNEYGGTRKIDFMPSIFECLHYFFNKKLIGGLLDFKKQLRDRKTE